MSYNLFLDDGRYPKDVKWIELPPVHWEIVRNYKQFVEIILKRGVPRIVSFDHDLADEHYEEYEALHDERLIPSLRHFRYEKMTEKTGRDCALFLANYCIDNKVPLPLYYLHSLNGIGCANIFSIMESARKVLNGDVNQ